MPLALTINGRAVSATVEPRMHLADFLREKQNLTGTHLGCEHGVCGACTVLIDGEPARSCITYAVACEGASIITIEGLDDDEIVRELRMAFSREHALQCGYCTPGMLVSARDIVLRADAASEQEIRVAMSGNLCRCTGYVGIVRAIASTIAARRARGIAAVAVTRPLGPVGSGNYSAAAGEPPPEMARARRELQTDRSEMPHAELRNFEPATRFDQSFVVQHPIDQVWAFFGRVPDVVACLPGATLSGQPADGQASGRMRIRVGPLTADFRGVAEFDRDDATHSGVIRGSGRDTRSTSATRGSIRYRLFAIGERATRVEFAFGYTLTGPLAQFSRTDLVQDIAGRLIKTFLTQLEARLSGQAVSALGELHAGGLIFSVLAQRLRGWIRRLLGRGGVDGPR
jgi:aerobic carbon-monoxide dehydrogenase small subunit